MELWETSSLVTIENMFRFAYAFNTDLSLWNVSRLKNAAGAFHFAETFSQNLCPWGKKLGNDTVFDRTFTFTACPDQGRPDMSSTPPGPFCIYCL